MTIKVESLTKIYGSQKALDSISFEAHKGEILGFLGPNGAGKSTTMKILTGYIPGTSGKAFINGNEINENSIAIRKEVGYLPELNPLYTDMYVKEYLVFIANTYGLKQSANEAAESMITKTGLTAERNKKIGQLSKGYKQRVGLAAAMIHNPSVLILDEPTSGLDPNQVTEIRHLIKEISKDKTVILSSHIMQEVEAMCNRVVIINKGKIVADNTIEKLQQALSKEFIIDVEFKNNPSPSELQAIDKAFKISTTKNGFTIRAAYDAREKIAQQAAQNNWLVLSMHLEESSLEEVFQSLTK
ncbi:MAG: gliding motility-associated ABC transporter ATP-binding subunit GldA [Bacteroidota bacterium]